ncbi:MAG: glycosyltransferase family 2 protein [Mastigocoleus sp. MO_188.B34]|nr:glycosyltransferase family 2 protein [Mastigocoleus sp. MO_188.B34]MDJ0694387.1 glycosyltransferase family 2 protein [Mastigocoleus sp. MO_188.B34]
MTIFATESLLIPGAIIVSIPCLVLFVESFSALFPLNLQPGGKNRPKGTKVTILIPAHDEESVICATLKQLSLARKPEDKVVVIADNCQDRTAEIARAAGATVIERYNSDLKGKGYALDYGLNFLENDPPDVVIFVDADCYVESSAIDMLVAQAIYTGKPVQASYLMEAPPNPRYKDLISNFAFKVKNLVRFEGLKRLGLPCLLTGTGMAFPWKVIRSIDLASGHITEDMKLGMDLTLAGYEPVFCSQAIVKGYLPSDNEAATKQRTRWEHGHLQTLLTYVPQMLLEAFQQKRLRLFLSALDLSVPPLSLLVVMWSTFLGISLLVGILGISWIPAMILTVAGCCLLLAISIAWVKFGRADIPLHKLLIIPIYVLWKIPIYLKFLVKPQKVWERTKRESIENNALG